MVYIDMEKLMENAGSRYKLVIMAARRTLELSEGKPKLTDAPVTARFAIVALKEIAENKITFKLRAKEKQPE